MTQIQPTAHPFTILVVDDEPDHVRMAAKIFAKHYNVLTAESAQAALQVVQSQSVDLALVDYRMPGATGNDFLEQLARIAPRCLRFLVTGDSDRRTVQDAVNRAQIYRFVSKPVSYAQLLEDIRLGLEHRTAAEVAANADRLATAGLTACIAAHDIRNGLQGLSMVPMYLQLGSPDDLQSAQRTVEYAQRIFQACVDEILAVSKGDKPTYRMSEHALGDLVAEAARYEATSLKDRDFQVDIAADLPRVNLSPTHCRRMLGNLLRNALQATCSGGRVHVRVFCPAPQQVSVSVADNGGGIPADIVKRMFQSFNSSKGNKGAGFGLKMCKEVMDAHGGSLTFTTQPGEGTTFTATFNAGGSAFV